MVYHTHGSDWQKHDVRACGQPQQAAASWFAVLAACDSAVGSDTVGHVIGVKRPANLLRQRL